MALFLTLTLSPILTLSGTSVLLLFPLKSLLLSKVLICSYLLHVLFLCGALPPLSPENLGVSLIIILF